MAIVARGLCALSLGAALSAGCTSVGASDGAVDITPSVASARAAADVDDPAIWVHPTDQSRSLVVATVKAAAPAGALMVFGLDGQLVQTVAGLDRPNNVDIEYGLELGGRKIDIVVVTERLKRQLRLFRIADNQAGVVEIGSVPVLSSARGDEGAPMGIGLYRRPADGRVFAIVAPKQGPARDYLWQYRLEDDGQGRVAATLVRRFGAYSGKGEIEAIAVDDALGYVYYADELSGIHKWLADPDAAGADTELAQFGREGFVGDREGIAIYAEPNGTGYIICTDQRPGRSEFRLYRREGEPGRPHDHQTAVKVVSGPADSTDGIEVSARPLGEVFRQGMLVAMNSRRRNFLFFQWEQLAFNGQPKLDTAGVSTAR